MRCTRTEKFLPLHVAGDLTGRRARTVAKHLTTCAACRHAAAAFDPSRNLLRAGAASLPPEFDGAFYEEIRNSVLAQIKQGRTLAPPPPPASALASFFNMRLAYAASLALVVLAAALSLHSFLNRTFEDDRRQNTMAHANSAFNTPPTATTTTPLPQTNRATESVRPFSQASDEPAGGGRLEGMRAAKSPLPKRLAFPRYKSHNEAQTHSPVVAHTRSRVRRNPLAHDGPGITQTSNPQELATGSNNSSSGDAAKPLTEISRIEIQTSDPNIRIIWLAPGTDSAQPLN